MTNDQKVYQKKLKENIGILIENNKLKEARELITQYENIINDDIDIYSIKGVIAMMEGDMGEAERVLKEGLCLDGEKFDLLYNLAYLYQTNRQNELAIEYYKKALKNAKSKNDSDGVYEILKVLGVKESKEEIIESVTAEEKVLSEKTTEKLNPSEEMEKYQKQFKENIQSLIEQGLLKEAKTMINEYEKIVKDDIDIYSIKGVIAMMEGDMDEAERVLKEGLEIKYFNFDILYNLAYLYETDEKYIISYRYYNKALKVANREMIEVINTKIEELEKIEKVKEYISRKKVLFVAHIFPPVGGSGVQRSLKFVKYLRNFGWEPVVVTVGKTIYPLRDETMVSEIPEEMEIIRIDERVNVDTKYANKLVQLYSGVINNNEIMQEYINELNKSPKQLNKLLFIPDTYIIWATEVLDKIDDRVDFKEIDMIYTTSGPYSDHIIGYYLKQKYYKPWVADFRDEWTNNPYVNFDKNHILYKVNFAMESNIVHKADKVITVTPISKQNYEKIFKLESHKVHQITNGYDEEDFINLSKKKHKNKKFTIMHNGLLYLVRTPLTFIKAIRNLIKSRKIKKSNIKIIFGWTENIDKWIQIRDELGLKDVIEFLDYMTHENSLKEAYKSDLLLLIVGPGEKNKSVFPGKIFEYLRLCKPILALSPKGSVVEELLKDTNRGKNVEFNNINQIEKCILEMYKGWEEDSNLKFEITENVKKFERKNLTKELCEVLLEAFDKNRIKETAVNRLNNCNLVEKSRNFYDTLFNSGGWNKTYFKHYSETHYFDIWLKALDLINEINNPQIIEIGCGPGQFANLLFDNGIKNYRGIDFSQEAIKYAKIRNDKYKNLFSVDNAYTTDIFNKDYNIVIIFEVLEHVDEDLKILSRIKRGSNILFSVPNFYSDGHVRWFNSKQEVIDRYKEYVNFEDILSFSVGGMNKIFLIKGKVIVRTSKYELSKHKKTTGHILLSNNKGFCWIKKGKVFFKGYIGNDISSNLNNIETINQLEKIKEESDFIDKVSHLNGAFSIVIENDNNILCCVDQIRSFPLFYYCGDGIFYLSDSIDEIKKELKSPSFNHKALSELKMTGYITMDDTIYKDIRKLQAGQYLMYDKINKNTKVKFYYEFKHNSFLKLKDDVLLQKLDKCYLDAFRRMLKTMNDRIAVIPLSGGCDSRCIAVSLKRLGYKNVICYSYGRKGNEESIISKKIANILGYKWEFIPYSEEIWEKWYRSKKMKEYMDYASNGVSSHHIQDWPAVMELKRKKLIPEDSIFIPGYSGDMIAGNHIPNFILDKSQITHENIIKYIFLNHYNLYSYNSFDKDTIQYFINKIVESENISNIKEYDSEMAADIIERWNYKNRQANYINNALRVYEFWGYEWRTPFWDKEILKFWEQISVQKRINRNLYFKYDDYLKRNFLQPLNKEMFQEKLK